MSPRRRESARRGSLFIGRLFEIEFYLDFSWFFIAALVTYTLASDILPEALPDRTPLVYVALGAFAAALFFISILLHELGHSVVSQRCGIPVPRITLLFIGGLAEIAREPDDARSELKIALGGPAVSLILVAVFSGGAWLLGRADAEGLAQVCAWLAATNLALVVFNMIPGYPLDGGRVLRAILWARSGRLRRATFIASRIGIGFSWLLIGLGILTLVTPGYDWHGFLPILIGLFLKQAAVRGYHNAVEREILAGLAVGDVMTCTPIWIPEHLPVSRAVDEYFLANHHTAFPVCTVEGEFRGLLQLASLKAIRREKWPYTTAGDAVAAGDSTSLTIDVARPAARAMRELLAPGRARLVVVDGGKLVGIVTRRDMRKFVEIQTVLER